MVVAPHMSCTPAVVRLLVIVVCEHWVCSGPALLYVRVMGSAGTGLHFRGLPVEKQLTEGSLPN